MFDQPSSGWHGRSRKGGLPGAISAMWTASRQPLSSEPDGEGQASPAAFHAYPVSLPVPVRAAVIVMTAVIVMMGMIIVPTRSTATASPKGATACGKRTGSDQEHQCRKQSLHVHSFPRMHRHLPL
jgi:hypothetical protein